MEDKPIEQKESIKLTKNAKGDYQWEIKLHFGTEADEFTFKRLEEINKKLEEKFGKK